jgi:sec-independent protein translocase protein TatC
MSELHPIPIHQYLIEIRQRLLRCLILICGIFTLLCYFNNDIYHLLATPLLKRLPEGSHLIATDIMAPFITPMKLTFIVSIFLAVPLFLYELWGFIAPGLYQKEKRWILPLLITSIFCFILGISFAYFIVFPLIFRFLIATAPPGVTVMPDIHHYLSFTLQLFFAFGCVFEVPVAVILLIRSGVVEYEKLRYLRPYVIVGSFILGMLFAPPDVLSQVLLALPIWWLYEIGLLVGRFLCRKNINQQINSGTRS